MKIELKFKLLLVASLLSVLVFSQARSQAYVLYINMYSDLAIKQQKEYGIPASITLAQALLESGAGNSPFARESNNHFGIKCNDWTGEKIYHDDDAQGECFRKYSHVEESFVDHSLFLKNRNRYAFLFDLSPTDYESWAFGLKKAGYATDPTYGYKLIGIIENYELHQFDLGKTASFASNKSSNSDLKSTHKFTGGFMGAIVAAANHDLYKVNGVKFVNSISGDNFAIIADEFNLSVKRLLAYNDLANETQLVPGTRVFIAKKKNRAPKECTVHRVLPGESMRSISQDYGVKVAKLYKINQLDFSQSVKIGQTLKLR